MTIGNQIREIRKQLGLTQSELAFRCGVTLRTIQRIEKGEVTPSAYTLGNLKKELGTEFVGLKEDQLTEKSFSNSKLYQTMYPLFSSFASLPIGKTILSALAIVLMGLGISLVEFTDPIRPSTNLATVETVNCGSDSECDILLTVKNDTGEIRFQKIYGGSSYDKASEVISTPDGGFLILGSTSSFGNGNYDILLIKTDPNGLTLWEKTYGGFFNEYGQRLALNSSQKTITIEGSQQKCTTPNVSEFCIQEAWKFEIDFDGNQMG